MSRKNVVARDKGICQYCSKHCTGKDITMDHVLPKSRGSKLNWANIVLACRSYNNKKDNKTPQEANMKLLNQPVKPRPNTKALDKLLEEFGFSLRDF